MRGYAASLVSGAALAALAAGPVGAAEQQLSSPDGALRITVSDSDGQARYAVGYKGRPLLAPSPLGLALSAGGSLSHGLKITGVVPSTNDTTYDLVAGKTRTVRDHYNQLSVDFQEPDGGKRRLRVIVRAYDDGVAFRYVLPQQAGRETVDIRNEETRFDFPADYRCWGLNLGKFGTSHEGEFDPVQASKLREHNLYDAPLVCEGEDGGAAFAIAEADLKDYAGLYLTGRGDGGLGVQVKLSPRLDEPRIAVRGKPGADIVSSWRVVMVAPTAGKLIESSLVATLNPPTALADTRWIKPGKAAWDWWNGPVVSGVPKAGMNDATIKAYIDFAAANGLDYMLIDDGWYRNSGGAGTVKPGADITKTIPEIDMPGLVAYAAERKVGLWVWAHWKSMDDQMDEALALYERWGLKGIKVDFMDRDDQAMVDYYHRLLTKAGQHHLMVDLHGAYHPTGLTRTYPHYLTQEGVLGAEYNKWSRRITATHNVTLPYTRMLLGPMDYTPGGFRNVAPAAFKPRNDLPFVQTTRGQALALYVVYDSPFGLVSDSPDTYRDSPAGLDFVSAAPTTWDETRFVAGEIGQSIVLARRKGADWWIGAMTNEAGRTVKVPLGFLGTGVFAADIRQDGAAPTDLTASKRTVKAGDVLTLKLAPSGGAAVHLTPAP
ncbi:alpha-glucosidase [Caulobacter sp. Root487D2Y]|uniref:glycoside hydrolase family 97 protein n=1 Tax=Caulobacter sp. Root487D2Y TaxID=1736547 RepID=UPI0006FB61BD|nr:glycoside hydrolase family 97 protein [Caulobacter sp. Root487D2Y]KQY31064.1 alpha-glucosidase [Caulobacter sp. Root487D2Y]